MSTATHADASAQTLIATAVDGIIVIDVKGTVQMLINLIRGSIEAMQIVSRRELTVQTSADSECAFEVAVTDTRPGLSEDIAARLFPPFVTTKEMGTGIGLTICQSIVEAHSSRIWATPKPGVGVEFRFSLPAKQLE